MTKKPILWTMTDEEIIEELDRTTYWYDASYTTEEQKALSIIAEAVKRLLKRRK